MLPLLQQQGSQRTRRAVLMQHRHRHLGSLQLDGDVHEAALAEHRHELLPGCSLCCIQAGQRCRFEGSEVERLGGGQTVCKEQTKQCAKNKESIEMGRSGVPSCVFV